MLSLYQDVARKTNPLVAQNPLMHTKGMVIPLTNRIDELEATAKWKKLVKEYTKAGTQFSSVMPQCKMVRLGDFALDEDIQRALDKPHCAKIGLSFNPLLSQAVSAIKIPGKEEYHSTDGQHTLTVIASLVKSGLFDHYSDWRDFEIACVYIETNNKAFARKSFNMINGKGKKQLTRFDKYRIAVMTARIDGDRIDADAEHAELQQLIFEKYGCFPVNTKSNLVRFPGAVTHLSSALSLSLDELEFACKWHNDYFHYLPTDGTTWFMLPKLKRAFEHAKIPLTEELLEDFAGLVQNQFVDLQTFKTMTQTAFSDWQDDMYGYHESFNEDCQASIIVQLYVNSGGTKKVPSILLDQFDGISEFI